MNIEGRITYLENNLPGQDRREPPGGSDGIIRKLGFDPDAVRDTAKEKNICMLEVIANGLGMTLKDFRERL
jgi:hypothetical protein